MSSYVEKILGLTFYFGYPLMDKEVRKSRLAVCQLWRAFPMKMSVYVV